VSINSHQPDSLKEKLIAKDTITRAASNLKKIQSQTFDRDIRILNVCGGHERTISDAGLRSLLPEQLKLIPGPGCPICVCPAETINHAISLSNNKHNIVACFGDMINVPANNKKSEVQSLKEAKASGNNIAAVSSPAEVIKLALANSDKTIIFFVAGFETTMAPIAAMLDQINHSSINNVKFLISGKKTWPIVSSLLNNNDHNLDGIIAPGHVATIMGEDEWKFIPAEFKVASAISGFTIDSMLSSIHAILSQIKNKSPSLENHYQETVTHQGNPTAQKLIKKYFNTGDSMWRGIGNIKNSGFTLKSEYQHINAELLIENLTQKTHKSDTPSGCDCPKVTMGQLTPTDCILFNKACTPSNPIGACMVSDEGACQIWWHTLPMQNNQCIST